LNDGDFTTVFDGGDSDCFIEVIFGDGLTVDIESIRYVPKVDMLLSNFEGMMIQGLEAGAGDYTDLYELVLTDLLSGFNYFYMETRGT
jgi:hypothetical protein